MIVVGFAGTAKVGKDSSAVVLKQKGFEHLSFARPLKELCSRIFPVTYEMFDSQEYKDKVWKFPIIMNLEKIDKLLIELNKHEFISNEKQTAIAHKLVGKAFHTPRQILQCIGSDIVRDMLDSDFWCKVLKNEMIRKDVVITDVRFPNERKTIKEANGVLILVKRPGFEGSNHISDKLLGDESEYDYIINNDGTLEDLHRKVESLYVQIENKI